MSDRLSSNSESSFRAHAAQQDWTGVERALDARGNALLSQLLTPAQCRQLAAMYPSQDGFRSRVVMSRHGFGRGEYK